MKVIQKLLTFKKLKLKNNPVESVEAIIWLGMEMNVR